MQTKIKPLDPSISSKRRAISVRAVLLGLALISLFYTSVFALTVLVMASGVLRRWAPRRVFSQAELITVYVMLNIGGALSGHDLLSALRTL